MTREVPEIDWMTFFNSTIPAAISYDEKVVSYSMPFFKELGKILTTIDKKVLYNYVIWRIIMHSMPHLPPQYQIPRAEFRRVLLGVLVDRNRWFN